MLMVATCTIKCDLGLMNVSDLGHVESRGRG